MVPETLLKKRKSQEKERAEKAQLHGLGALGEDLTCLQQPLRRLKLALRIDDLGASQAFCLRLLGNGAHHRPSRSRRRGLLH